MLPLKFRYEDHAYLGQVSKTDTMMGFLRRLLGVGITTGVFTVATLTAYTIAFGLARSIALPILFQIPLASPLFRPFLGHFLRERWNLAHLWRNRAFIWHAFLLGLTTIGGWEFTESLFDDEVREVSVLLCIVRLLLRTGFYSSP